jgi:hypothetical protein
VWHDEIPFRLFGALYGTYIKFIGASPEPRKLLKKLDQNFSREKS